MKRTKDGRGRRAVAATGTLALAALLGAWAAAAPPAPEPAPLTLAEAAQRALAQHPAVGAAAALRDEARAAAGEAGASRYPTVRLTGSATRYEEPMVVAPLHGRRRRTACSRRPGFPAAGTPRSSAAVPA